MMTMTVTAVAKVQDFIEEHGVEGGVGLRVAVLPGGCSGFQYGLNIEDAPEDAAGPFCSVLPRPSVLASRCRQQLRPLRRQTES